MSKAEERALKAYPNILFPFTPLDLNAYRRDAFIKGYETAEKYLALTPDDVKLITKIHYEIVFKDTRLISIRSATQRRQRNEIPTEH